MAVSQAQFQQFDAFKSITESQFQAIADYAKVEMLPKGTFIIKRGKPLKALVYLIDGKVDLVDASFSSESVHGRSGRARHPLTEQSPADVSAMAKSDVEILSVDPQAIEILKDWSDPSSDLSSASSLPLESGSHESGEDWMTSLLDSPLFARVQPAQLQLLFASFEPVQVSEGHTVVEESDIGDYFYVIETGRATVSTRFDGELATLGPGQFFGEEALVGDTIRNASVVMCTGGVLMRLSKEDFKDLLQKPLIRFISSEQLNKWVLEGESCQLLDVRIPLEYRIAHVDDSTNIPLASLRKRLVDLDHATTYVVTDDAGKRSEVAAHLMCQAGFTTYILEDSAAHYSDS